jgi:hypothetical protein
MSSCNEFAETACRLTLETGAPPHLLLPHVRRLRRLATSHARRCVVQCNGCPTCGGSGFVRPIESVPPFLDATGSKLTRACEEDHPNGRPCPTCQTDTIEEAIRGVCGELTQLRRSIQQDAIKRGETLATAEKWDSRAMGIESHPLAVAAFLRHAWGGAIERTGIESLFAGAHLPNGGEFTTIFTYDPRGATVKLRLPSGAANNFGGDGWCVPTTGRV